MSQALTDSKTDLITIGVDDSRSLAIIYGSLGTLIAFASLVVAILSWLKSCRQKLVAQRQAADDVDMQNDTSQHPRHTDEDRSTAIVNHEYVVDIITQGQPQKLTSYSDTSPAMPQFMTAHTSRPQSPFELDGNAVLLPSHTDESYRVASSINICDHSSATLSTATSTT